MKKAYVIRYGAFGDHVHASQIPRMLKEREGFDHVAFEYNPKGHAVYFNNPFIDQHIHFDPYALPPTINQLAFIKKRIVEVAKENSVDHIVDLTNCLEYGYIAMEDQNDYYRSTAYRREKYGKNNFYDQTMISAGYPQHVGMRGELYFDANEEHQVKRLFQKQWKDNFVVMVNLSGTSKHKLFYDAEAICKEFLKKHPEAVIVTIGDEDCQKYLEFSGDRIFNRAGVYPFWQGMLMSKYADMVVSGESGIICASTAMGTASVQLMTCAGIAQHGGGFDNDFSVQSPAKCSPCHKGPYENIGCPTFKHINDVKYPVCVKFDSKEILERMEEAYDYARARKENSASDVSIM